MSEQRYQIGLKNIEFRLGSSEALSRDANTSSIILLSAGLGALGYAANLIDKSAPTEVCATNKKAVVHQLFKLIDLCSDRERMKTTHSLERSRGRIDSLNSVKSHLHFLATQIEKRIKEELELLKITKAEENQPQKTDLKWTDPMLCLSTGEWHAKCSAQTPIGVSWMERPIERTSDVRVTRDDVFLENADTFDEASEWVNSYLKKVRDELNDLNL